MPGLVIDFLLQFVVISIKKFDVSPVGGVIPESDDIASSFVTVIKVVHIGVLYPVIFGIFTCAVHCVDETVVEGILLETVKKMTDLPLPGLITEAFIDKDVFEFGNEFLGNIIAAEIPVIEIE